MIKAIIPAMALFSVMMASCILFPDPVPKGPVESTFYARNIATRDFYTVKARMMYEGEKCEIWAEVNSGVTEAEAKNIAREYDNKIRAMIVEAFGSEFDDGSDILDYANWLVGRDNRKLTILLLDIQDNFDLEKENYSYVAGYFWAGNFFPQNINDYSNERDMIYVDTYPGLKMQTTQAYATFAHELQHLVNFVTTVLINRTNSQNALLSMDTWIDEGLSSYAEFLYLDEQNLEDKCEWFSEDPNKTIGKGNNFFVWGNYDNDRYAILDDYATVYLFFRWLYLQAAGTELQSHIFRDIAHSEYPDYRAVTGVAQKINPAWGNWEDLLGTWLAANHDPKNAVYGYKGDLYLQEGYGSTPKTDPKDDYKGIRVNPIGGLRVPLYPGEGVYSIIKGSYSTIGGSNIRYEELAGNTRNVTMLLTFNANTYNTYDTNNPNDTKNAAPETGSLTGVAPPVTASRAAAENALPGKRTPYVIDARDMLGQDHERLTFRVP